MYKKMPAQFLEGAPEGVYEIFDMPETTDRYTIFFAAQQSRRGEYVPYLGSGADPRGVSYSGEMSLQEFEDFRNEKLHGDEGESRIKWSDLPEPVQRIARRDADEWLKYAQEG